MFMMGKWYFGSDEGELFDGYGFDCFFVFDVFGVDNWEDKFFMLFYRDVFWFEDGSLVSLLEDFYFFEFIVDKMIEYVVEEFGILFFVYLVFQVIYIFVQVLFEFIVNYQGIYDDGW